MAREDYVALCGVEGYLRVTMYVNRREVQEMNESQASEIKKETKTRKVRERAHM